MDILRMLELRSHSKPLIKQQYQNELIQRESINVIEGSYGSLFNQKNRAKIEEFFAPKMCGKLQNTSIQAKPPRAK